MGRGAAPSCKATQPKIDVPLPNSDFLPLCTLIPKLAADLEGGATLQRPGCFFFLDFPPQGMGTKNGVIWGGLGVPWVLYMQFVTLETRGKCYLGLTFLALERARAITHRHICARAYRWERYGQREVYAYAV